jgi:hypothetical protein
MPEEKGREVGAAGQQVDEHRDGRVSEAEPRTIETSKTEFVADYKRCR